MDLRVKDICKEKGISITGLAGRIGIDKAALSRLINVGNPTVSTLQKIAAALEVSFIELFEAKSENCRNICPKCGMKIDAAAVTLPATPLPVNKTKTGNSLFDYIEKCTDTIGGIGLSKHLRAYSGGNVLVSQVDDNFYDGFIEYLKTAKKSLNPSIGNVISETYQKRLKSCFDEILEMTKEQAAA